jgi:hypothetical protein
VENNRGQGYNPPHSPPAAIPGVDELEGEELVLQWPETPEPANQDPAEPFLAEEPGPPA